VISIVERYYLVESIVGDMIIDEKGNIIEYVPIERDPKIIASRLLEKEEGNITPELSELLNKVIGRLKEDAEIVLEDEALAKKIAVQFKHPKVRVETPSKGASIFRSNLDKYLKLLGISKSDYNKLLWSTSIELSRTKIKERVEKRDLFIAQAITILDEIDRTVNLYASKIREWYSLHFPELNNLIRDHKTYATLVYNIGHRSNFTEENLRKMDLPRKNAAKIAKAAEESMGADITDFDLDVIKQIARLILNLYDLRKLLEKYIDEAMMDVAPNTKGLVGSLLGARLIALAGSLKELATLPASTIQVLGAEKALFRALRTGTKPPKHGVIFTHPTIFRAPRWQRGKIARALAAKLAIAARIDAFGNEYKADILKSEFEERVKEIKTLYQKPPKRKREKPVKRRKRKRT